MPSSALETYAKKRHFDRTPEPEPEVATGSWPPRFVIQRHAARREHYDLRLEAGGTLLSWAVPKGIPAEGDPPRLAVKVEDHPLDYADFEGRIPAGNYGAGEVIVWDRGLYLPGHHSELSTFNRSEVDTQVKQALETAHLSLRLYGHRLRGQWTLVPSRGENEWLLLYKKGQVTFGDESVLSGRTLADIASGNSELAISVAQVSRVDGARSAKIPGPIRPMLASQAPKPFSDSRWLFEPKLDGMRALAFVCGGKTKLYSRAERDITIQYPALVNQLAWQPEQPMILDGEIVALDSRGAPSFERLQERIGLVQPDQIRHADAHVPVVYLVFDILYLDNYDLRNVVLEDRKEILNRALVEDTFVRKLEVFEEDGEAAYEAVMAHGFEGLVAKRLGSTYITSRRTTTWLKIKGTNTDEFVIGGYTRGEGRRESSLGALLLGYFDDGQLRFTGHVGSGFTDESIQMLLKRLEPLRTEERPFAEKPPVNRPSTWVRPELVAEVKYQLRTKDGHLRSPVFLRLRDDKPAREVAAPQRVDSVDRGLEADKQPERKRAATKDLPLEEVLAQLDNKKDEFHLRVGEFEIKLSNLNKVFWPETEDHGPLTKRDLITYYARISPAILPHLYNRPLTMTRYPNGIEGGYFYQRHLEHRPEFVKTVETVLKTKPEDDLILCNNLTTLLWLGQVADLELHTWFARVPESTAETEESTCRTELDCPDFLVFDIDPYLYSGKEKAGAEPEPHEAGFAAGCQAARWLKEALDALKLRAFIKTSGRTGLHVFVPIVPDYPFETIRSACRTLCRFVEDAHPKEITTEWSTAKRTGKVFLDYNMNVRGKSVSSIYSPRITPEASVSTPVDWEELGKLNPLEFTILTVPKRFEQRGDLWAGILDQAQNLGQLVGDNGQELTSRAT